jgi:uncharacterized repeat protein (TIGR01451 family)
MPSRGIWLYMGARTRKSVTLLWVALFVFSLLLQYASFASPASTLAATGLKAGTVSGFEIDGDLKSGDAASNPGAIPPGLFDSLTNGDDWLQGDSGTGVVDPASPPRSKIIADKANSSTDDEFIGGAKELDTCTWGYDLGPVTGKDDVKHVMAYAKFVGTSAFFYMGAERIINNGDTHVDFELNQKAFTVFPGDPNVSKPNRTAGDLIISLEYSNGGSNPEVTVYQVDSVTNCTSGGKVAGQDITVNDITKSTSVHSATNFVDLPNAGFGYTIPSFEFAEASINLADLGIQTSCPGLSSGSIRTRAGGDISSSQLKDTVDPFPIDLNNCGQLRIEKHAGTTSGALLGGATFTVSPNPIPGGSGTLTIADNSANDGNNTDGRIDISPAKPGDYTVCETVAPTGYNLPTPVCQDVTVPNNGTFADATVKFADPRKTATTTLVRHSASPADGSFIDSGASITLTVRETNTGESTLSSVNITGTNSCATTGATAGTWVASSTKVGGGAYSGSLATGEAVDFTCTFTADGNDFSWSATGHGTDELGDPASLTGETTSGSYDVLMPATTLTIVTNAPAQVHQGDPISIVVKEANTGEGTITNVHVDGTGPCASNWVAAANKNNASGAFSGSLAPGESVNFTCSFNAGAADFSWSADGKGADALGHAVPATGEHQAGSVDVVSPATALTIKTAPPAMVHAGDPITIVVNEKNTGDGTLTNVHVVAGGDCPAFTPASVTLAADAGQDFTCTFNAPSNGDDVTWTADGKGTDSLGASAPADGEHQEGSVIVIKPSTSLATKSAPTKVHAGDTITVVVTETNTGDDTLTNVYVVAGGSCPSFSPASTTLAPGASADFTCAFSAPADGTDVSWTADGKGTDSLGAAAPSAGEHQQGSIVVIKPATTLRLKSSSPADLGHVLQNSSVTITVTETNTGDDTLSDVNVTGTNSCATWAPVGAFSGTLAPNATQDFSCTFSVTTSDVSWSATGHGTDSLDAAAPADGETVSGLVHVVNPNIDVVKSAGTSLGSQAANGAVYETQDGTTVVYRIEVTTQDPDGLHDIVVTDDKCSPVVAVTSGGPNVGDTNGNTILDPGETWVYQCSKLESIAADGKNVHDVATAVGQPTAGGPVSDNDDADVTLLVPGIQTIKTAGDAADGGTYTTEAFPNNVAYHYSIKNTGELALSNVVVRDDNGTPANTADDFTVCTIPSLAIGATATCSKTLTITADTTNVAVATGHTAQKPNEDVSDNDNAVVDIVGASIRIIKTAGTAADGQEFVTEPGPVTYHYAVTNTGEVDLFNVTVVDDNGTPANTADDILIGTIDKLAVGQTVNLSKVINVTGNRTNVAVASGHTEQKPNDKVTDNDNAVVRVPNLTINKSVTGNTAGNDPTTGDPVAKEGDFLTYTLAYTLTNGPVTNGVITDVLPAGLAYVAGSASGNSEFTFTSYDPATRTLRWDAPTVTKSGAVAYQVQVTAGAAALPQPMTNVATIDSTETKPSTDTQNVFVSPPPLPATATPRVTLPPTDTLDTTGQTPSNPGFGLMLTLVGLAALALGVGFITPVPESVRRRDRRSQTLR